MLQLVHKIFFYFCYYIGSAVSSHTLLAKWVGSKSCLCLWWVVFE